MNRIQNSSELKLWGCTTKGREIGKSNWTIIALYEGEPEKDKNKASTKKKKQSVRKLNHSKLYDVKRDK